MTFDEWWDIWRKSRRYSRRGNYKGGYVMARYGDKGPYALGNVRITLARNNVQEANTGRPRPDVGSFNRSRTGIPLAPEHKAKIVAAMRRRNGYEE